MTPPVAGLSPRVSTRIVGPVNLHDWIDELCDALDLDAEVDEALVLDLARVAAHNVVRPAAPVSTFLLGLAAGRQGAGPEEIEELAALDAMYDKGTNLHHGLLLANRHFRKHPNAQPVLLVVTDGEPTSHLEPDGEVFFSYPPHPLTIAYAVRELDNARRLGAQTTFFRLGEDPGLARFIDSMASRVEGRVVAPELDDLGSSVVGSYLGDRSGFGRSSMGGYSDWFGGRGFWVGG